LPPLNDTTMKREAFVSFGGIILVLVIMLKQIKTV